MTNYAQQPPPQQQQQYHQQQQPVQAGGFGQPQQGQNLLHDKDRIHDREHIKEHLHGVLGDPDLSKLSEEELQFHYFKMHDNDNNNKLDGCELIKSLIHWHGKLTLLLRCRGFKYENQLTFCNRSLFCLSVQLRRVSTWAPMHHRLVQQRSSMTKNLSI